MLYELSIIYVAWRMTSVKVITICMVMFVTCRELQTSMHKKKESSK